MIKKTMNKHEFIEIILHSEYINKFSIIGLEALFEYLEDLSEDIGEDIEFDLVAIAWDYSETTLEEVLNQYEDIRKEFEEYKNREEQANKPIEEQDQDIIKEIISQYTTVIEVNKNKIIIQDF